jgi:hypothetical protein
MLESENRLGILLLDLIMLSQFGLGIFFMKIDFAVDHSHKLFMILILLFNLQKRLLYDFFLLTFFVVHLGSIPSFLGNRSPFLLLFALTNHVHQPFIVGRP